MRFYTKGKPKKIDYGKKRYISKFFWFPKEINGEVRWLERALYEQVVDYKIVSDKDVPMILQSHVYYWRDNKWIDPPVFMR